MIAKLIVQNGTLRVGDVILCGSSYGRVKAMYDTLKPRKKLKEALQEQLGRRLAKVYEEQLDDLERAGVQAVGSQEPLALGAKAVGVGRAYLYALAAAGERGVDHLVELFSKVVERRVKFSDRCRVCFDKSCV